MSPWRPALRMARRDLRRHKTRAVLTCVLVALPVFVATVMALISYNSSYPPERLAYAELLNTDGSLLVSDVSAIVAREALDSNVVPRKGAAPRDPATVDLTSLLPAGSRVSAPLRDFGVTLKTGGTADVSVVDLTDPLTEHAAELSAGRAPQAPDEVAISRNVADQLGGVGSTIELAGGTEVRVVGEVRRFPGYDGTAVRLLAPTDTVIQPAPAGETKVSTDRVLVDLPPMSRPQLKALWRSLAAQGVAFRARDSILHREAWQPAGMTGDLIPIDPTPYVVGALCVLVGLLEVVLLVGAAFSVAARRQIRDLGLLATNGGAPADVRRVLLAQGLVLGVLSAAVGAVGGVLAFGLLATPVEDLLGTSLWRHAIAWPAVLVIAALGSVTAVIAALLPGWRVGRLTPVESLAGRFPLRPGESRAHRGAFVLVALGLVALTFGGWATARAKQVNEQWVGSAATVAGLGLVLLVAGTAWATPYVVRRVAGLGRRLPLAGRYAFRDAGRHRFRSAATVIALTVTVTGAVLAGFGFKSAARDQAEAYDYAPRTASVESFPDGSEPLVRKTLDDILEVKSMAAAYYVGKQINDQEWTTLQVKPSYSTVMVTDEDSLATLVKLTGDALATFRSGGLLYTRGKAPERLVIPSADGGDAEHWQVRSARVSRIPGLMPYEEPSFISAETAKNLGLTTQGGRMVVRTQAPVTHGELVRLRAYGLWADSDDPDRAWIIRLQYAGLGIAGLLAAVVVGTAVALAAAEGRDDVATLAAVGAAPLARRRFGAAHGLFLGLVGSCLGLAIGVPAGMAFTQLDGLPGIDMAWLPTFGTVGVVLLLSAGTGWLVTPSRFRLTRRVA